MAVGRLCNPLVYLLSGLVLVAGLASGAPAASAAEDSQGDALEKAMSERCPHAAQAIKQEHQAADRRRRPPILKVERPMLRRELLLRREQDQAMRGVPSSEAWAMDDEYGKEVDADNLRRLKHIVRQDGFPTARMVGYDGLEAAWLLVQHADADPAFQAEMLTEVRRSVNARELDVQLYALLTDRVLLAQGKKQRYGTQLAISDQGLTPRRLEDPDHVDERRRAMGLIPLADYECWLKAFNDVRAGH